MNTDITISNAPGSPALSQTRTNYQNQRGIKAHVLINDLFKARFGLGSLQDQFTHSPKLSFSTHLGDAHLKQSVVINGTLKDCIAFTFLNGERFTGNVGLVDRTYAAEDFTICGNIVARPPRMRSPGESSLPKAPLLYHQE